MVVVVVVIIVIVVIIISMIILIIIVVVVVVVQVNLSLITLHDPSTRPKSFRSGLVATPKSLGSGKHDRQTQKG
jgi:hypothetical protein